LTSQIIEARVTSCYRLFIFLCSGDDIFRTLERIASNLTYYITLIKLLLWVMSRHFSFTVNLNFFLGSLEICSTWQVYSATFSQFFTIFFTYIYIYLYISIHLKCSKKGRPNFGNGMTRTILWLSFHQSYL